MPAADRILGTEPGPRESPSPAPAVRGLHRPPDFAPKPERRAEPSPCRGSNDQRPRILGGIVRRLQRIEGILVQRGPGCHALVIAEVWSGVDQAAVEVD